ncbi:hypothetical protein R50073_06250 [Maricurvus nonylphenolicus]|uniref:putative metalloprotease CJM1_0395 family protein n=1 Tax=Maricurvus nonylphenolicus TaxID=1008307 RepID=UPI0036F255F3
MINPNVPSNFANAVSPFSPLGRQPVGEENADSRNTPFNPVEESSELARTENRRSPDERPGELDQRQRLDDRSQDEGSRGNNDDADQQRQQDQAERQVQAQEQQEIRQLSARDAEVRAHERAHSSVGGTLTGPPTYQFERGPDGVNYAVSGEVSINLSEVAGDPEATLEIARQARSAALAPAEPSDQDRRVASQAAQLELEARQDIAEQRLQERQAEAEADEAIQARREAEEAERAEREEERRRERDEALADTQAETVETAADRFAEINNRNIDLNRRLIEIGVSQPVAPTGGIFDQTV